METTEERVKICGSTSVTVEERQARLAECRPASYEAPVASKNISAQYAERLRELGLVK